MARDTWYRLDNIGKFYSSQAGSPTQTVFRYSATLTEDVNPYVLQHALLKTVGIFPGFNVCLRSGLFWHYLQQSPTAPQAVPESLPVCFGLHVDAKSVLFRVSYHRTRLNFEVSHIVSDGRGSLNFFKALLYLYLAERHGIEGVEVEYDGSDSQKEENSFDKYFERDKAGPTPLPRPYRLTGWHDMSDPTFLEYHLPVRPVLDLAHEYGVSMTSLLIAVIMASIREDMPQRLRDRHICMDVPVDLRQYFKSVTAKNFFGLAFVSYAPGEQDEDVAQVARTVHAQLKAATALDHLKQRVNRMVALEKNPFMRFVPLFIKDLALEAADRVSRRSTTTTLSNIGAIKVDPRLAPYIEDINILTSTTGLNFTVCSFGDDLSIGVSTVYSNLNVVKNLCRFFSARGIHGRVNINKTNEEIAEDQLEKAFEDSMRQLGEGKPGKGRAAGGEGGGAR